MKNIEKFNICTAFIFGKLYDEFPIWRKLDPSTVVAEMKGAITDDNEKKVNAATFVVNTLDWLVVTGYLIMSEGNTKASNRYVLSPKAFEVLSGTPGALQGKPATKAEESVGEKLAAASKDIGKEVSSEAKKQAISKMVGEVIGYAFRAMTSG